MLPYTGTFAKLGKFIDDGFRLYVEQKGGKLGGREIEYVQVDDESEPAKATDNMNRLVGRDKVDVVVGTVHSGVAMAMVKVARDSNTLLIIPNAGADDATGAACAPNIFRTSFSNWQPALPDGQGDGRRGPQERRDDHLALRRRRGDRRRLQGELHQGRRQVVEELCAAVSGGRIPGAAHRDRGAEARRGVRFFAGGGAVKFVKDYAAAGLNKTIPLYGSGFLTDGTLEAQGEAADGMKTTLHYADDSTTRRNKQFRAAFKPKTRRDGRRLRGAGLRRRRAARRRPERGQGRHQARDRMYRGDGEGEDRQPARADSFSKAHNPMQNIYLREVATAGTK